MLLVLKHKIGIPVPNFDIFLFPNLKNK